jgi:hypothetical protein
MELDEFKELYNGSTDKQTELNQNIMDIIHSESQSPLAELQKKIKYTLYIFPVAMVIYAGLFIYVAGIHAATHHLGSWVIFLILFPEYLVSVLNYYTIKKLQKPGGNVKENLANKVDLLKKRYKWYLLINGFLLALVPVFIEADFHYHLDGEFAGIGKINVFIRIAWYIIIFGGLLIIKSKFQKQNYDVYLDELSGILKQTE